MASRLYLAARRHWIVTLLIVLVAGFALTVGVLALITEGGPSGGYTPR